MLNLAKGNAKMIVKVERAQKLFQNQFDAALSLGEALTKSAGQIVAEAQNYSQSVLEANANLLQKLATVKSPAELFQLQNDYAKALYESSVARSAKIGGLLTDLSKEAANSLTASAEKTAHVVQTVSVKPFSQAAE